MCVCTLCMCVCYVCVCVPCVCVYAMYVCMYPVYVCRLCVCVCTLCMCVGYVCVYVPCVCVYAMCVCMYPVYVCMLCVCVCTLCMRVCTQDPVSRRSHSLSLSHPTPSLYIIPPPSPHPLSIYLDATFRRIPMNQSCGARALSLPPLLYIYTLTQLSADGHDPVCSRGRNHALSCLSRVCCVSESVKTCHARSPVRESS
jgi:hypothetical protein